MTQLIFIKVFRVEEIIIWKSGNVDFPDFIVHFFSELIKILLFKCRNKDDILT